MVEHVIKETISAVAADCSEWAALDWEPLVIKVSDKSERLASLVSERVSIIPLALNLYDVVPYSLFQIDEDIFLSRLAASVVRVEPSGVVSKDVRRPDIAANDDRIGVIGVALSSLPKEETTSLGNFRIVIVE